MDPKEQTPQQDESVAELDIEATPSVDDFIRELEAKEKDLHISSDMTIEVADPDFDAEAIPDSLADELAVKVPDHRSATPSIGMKTRIYELEHEVEVLRDRVESLRADRREIQEKSDRRLKDFESYKYRMDRERRGAFIDQISNLASQMLPVLDNFDRAINCVDGATDKNAEFQQFYDGIVLVHQQVSEVLSEMGVEPIATSGEIFDPNLHEAVAAEDRDDLPHHTIVEEMLRGYRIGNRIIRHSMVKVTTSPQRNNGRPAPRVEAESPASEPSPDIPAENETDGQEIN